MRIVRLAKRVPPCSGGQERHILELTIEQGLAGCEVTLLHADGALDGGPGWSAHRVTTDLSRLPSSLQSFRFGRAAAAWLRANRLRPDVIHAHGDYPEAWWAARLAAEFDCAAMVTTHASPGRRHPLRDRLRRLAYNRVDQVCGVNQDIGRQLQALGVTTPYHAQHSGTRLGPLRAIPRVDDGQTVVAVGRLAPLKGFPDLIAATALLADRWPDLRVVIVGGGPQAAELEALAAAVPQVVLTGEQPREEVYRWLRSATVFVQSSVDLPGIQEGLPTTLVEAVAAGVPVVATAVAGAPELIEQGVNGLLVPQRSPADLAAAIETLLADPARREAMAAANLARGTACDWAAVAAVFTDLAQRLVDQRQR